MKERKTEKNPLWNFISNTESSLTSSVAHANAFKWLKLEFTDFGRTVVWLKKYQEILGKERRTSEKNSFEIASHLAQDIFAIARKLQNSIKNYVLC